MLIRSGIMLVKYWFSVSDEEQERRFQARIEDPMRRWKLSPMDLESRERWVDYSRAKDDMFAVTDIKQAPWYVVNADDKRRARLNCIAHLLSLIPYEDLTPPPDRAAAAPARRRLRAAAAERPDLRPGGLLRAGVDLTPDQRAFLDEHRSAAMVTLRRDGTPHAVQVGVAVVDGALWSSGTARRARTRHLRRDPRATLFVFDGRRS